MPPVDLPALRASIPLVTASRGEKFRIRLGEVETGGEAPVIIAGPCAVENLGQLLRTTRRIKAAGAHGLYAGAFKPRSSPYGIRGLSRENLEMLAAAKIETGLFLGVEAAGIEEIDPAAEYADLLLIDARDMQNFALLRAAGRSRRPVLLKRGMSATIQEWLLAAEYILSEGNPGVILCEPGIRTFETMTRNTLDLASIPLAQSLTGLPVFTDPGHATGRRELVAPMARAALAAGADGLLLEVQPEPAMALSSGERSLTVAEFEALMSGLAFPFFPMSRAGARSQEPAILPCASVCGQLASQGYRHLPVYARFAADELTPIGIYRRLYRQGPGFLLESVEPGGNGVGRYSFYGDRPLCTISSYGRELKIEGRKKDHGTIQGDILDQLRLLLSDLRVAPGPDLPRFYGGAVGYLGYDYVRLFEPVPAAPPEPFGLPDSFWMIPERMVVLDHVTETVTVIILSAAEPGGYQEAEELLSQTIADLRRPWPPQPPALPTLADTVASSFSKQAFCDAVAAARERIADGQIFQVVLSQCLTTSYHGRPLDLYRALRSGNPSPYLFLLDCGAFQLIGSSPETHVRLENDRAEIKPLAGTRPRGADEASDRALEEELRADEKERAEHIMLVDLARNDLGRVCRYGTIQVKELMTVERFSRVMHMVSRVTGQLAPGQDAFSLLKATFPAGTLTGAPKVRAMQIIAELEPYQRGIYGGAIGYVGLNGNLDTCIAIRTIVLAANQAAVRVGAGIVADSEPEREYEESRAKAAAVLSALVRAKEGLA